jgi:hypothetical protein
MSDTRPTATDALVQRLVTDRVSAPGVLNRQHLERAHERFSQPARSHDLGRLHRRIEAASPNTASLPLVRIDRSVEPAAASEARPSNAVATPVGQYSVVRTATRAQPTDAPASAFVGALVARQAPTITRTSELVARRVAELPGIIGSRPSATRLMERSRSSAAAPSAGVPTPVVQRVADTRDSASARSVSATGPANPATTPLVVMRTASKEPAPPTAPRTASATTALPRASVRTAAHDSAPLLWRKVDASAQAPVVSAVRSTTVSPQGGAASLPLVFRKPDVHATPSPSRSGVQAPSTTSPNGVKAHKPAPPKAAPRIGAAAVADGLNLDWITEQVGTRLARRLEIERERMGVRPWRL